ncbi:MAG: formylglycine-generating enzyme family protein [Prevotellaceae bacterium]|jgi:formylglycine-generating enzyme required for sulfatase activity|nr:formylglycine-generating enzyme family protein [Prevotellaceae bacterium]
MKTARAQGSGNKPTLAVFVVGMDNSLGNSLTTELGTKLINGGQYALTAVDVTGKRDELRAAYTTGGGSSIDRNALAAWGRANGISAICLVVDDVKGSDHMFYAQLIDTKDRKLSGKGSYIRTGVGSGELTRVSSALAQQLNGPERKRSAPAPTRNYPAELDIEMVFVEGGTFEMGCTAEQTDCQSNEKPAHSVTLRSYYIGKYEVTQKQWVTVMGSNPSTQKGDDQQPVDNVKWVDVDTFLMKLKQLTGKNYRLPTEAEWEYAARGGAKSQKYKFSGGDDFGEVAWCSLNSSSSSRPVGTRKPNELGIYDMTGNVWEWCSDWNGVYSSASVQDPTGPATGSSRVFRGGGYKDGATWSRNAVRPTHPPTSSRVDLGFRVGLPAQ